MTKPMVALRKGTTRDTPCYKLNIGRNAWVVFSYETPIAFGDGKGSNGVYFRQPNRWGPTTGRHFNDLCLSHYPVIEDEDEFYSRMNAVLSEAILEQVTAKLE